jgi:regulatory protein
MQKKLRKIPTPQSLAAIALHYLGRYAASEASLRRVLTNRVRRAAMQHPEFAADAAQQNILRESIESIIASHKKTGVVNDATFAATKINSLRRQGRSRRAIQQKLAVKGVKSETIKDALILHDDGSEPEETDMKAALALARRRKFGTFRKKPADDDRRRKDMAAMARAGFSMSIILKILKTTAPEDFDATLDADP